MTPGEAALGGSILGMVAGGFQNQNQMNQQGQLMNLQLKNQKELNKQGSELSYQNWLRTNYSAQRAQMEKAGLNVGMMYGMGSGAGGSLTGGGGGSAAGGQAPAPNNQMAMLLGDLAANIDLKKAQAENLRAQTTKTNEEVPGVTLQNKYQELRNSYQQWENDMKAYDANRQPEMGRIALEKLQGEATKAVADGKISKKTADNQIKLAELEVYGKQIENDLKSQKIEESKANVDMIAQKIQESITWLEQNNRSVTAEEVKADAQKRMADFGSGVGAQIERGSRVLGNSVDAVMKVYKPKPGVKVEDYKGTDKDYTKTTYQK